MRLFIAINLSDAMKDSLISTQNALYDRGVRGNYTPEAVVRFKPWVESRFIVSNPRSNPPGHLAGRGRRRYGIGRSAPRR